MSSQYRAPREQMIEFRQRDRLERAEDVVSCTRGYTCVEVQGRDRLKPNDYKQIVNE